MRLYTEAWRHLHYCMQEPAPVRKSSAHQESGPTILALSNWRGAFLWPEPSLPRQLGTPLPVNHLPLYVASHCLAECTGG